MWCSTDNARSTIGTRDGKLQMIVGHGFTSSHQQQQQLRGESTKHWRRHFPGINRSTQIHLHQASPEFLPSSVHSTSPSSSSSHRRLVASSKQGLQLASQSRIVHDNRTATIWAKCHPKSWHHNLTLQHCTNQAERWIQFPGLSFLDRSPGICSGFKDISTIWELILRPSCGEKAVNLHHVLVNILLTFVNDFVHMYLTKCLLFL